LNEGATGHGWAVLKTYVTSGAFLRPIQRANLFIIG
jgi:hypothetical protein